MTVAPDYDSKLSSRLVRMATVVLAGLTIGAHRGDCQQIEFQSPDDVARAVLRADCLRDWRSLLALAHPEALVEFKRVELMRLGPDVRRGRLVTMDSCMQAQMARHERFTLDSIYHVASTEQLAQVSPDTLFTRYHRWFSRVAATEMDSLMPGRARTYLGHVLANDSTAFGVLLETYDRPSASDWPAEHAQIMTFRRFGSGWRSMLDPDFGQPTSFMMLGGCNNR